MKDRLCNVSLIAVVVAIALGYYFGHDFVNRLTINAPRALMQLAGR